MKGNGNIDRLQFLGGYLKQRQITIENVLKYKPLNVIALGLITLTIKLNNGIHQDHNKWHGHFVQLKSICD
jgi:hypothetical protein